MSLKLRVKEGAARGSEIVLTDGLEIGRDAIAFPLADFKISAKHGVFRQEADGKWAFIDLGSKNGTFFEAQKVSRVDLQAGTVFRVGETLLEILPLQAPAPNKKTWSEILEDAFLNARSTVNDEKNQLVPFFRPLRINITSGPQIDTSWIIAFGPRFVGQASEDFPIYLDAAPEICFEVVPHSQGVKIINHADNFVFFNDSRFREQNVLPGDRIKLGSMEMVLDYL